MNEGCIMMLMSVSERQKKASHERLAFCENNSRTP